MSARSSSPRTTSRWSKGDSYVPGPPPVGVNLFDTVELELATDFPPLDAPETVRGQVVQVIAGVGVAVAFKPGARLLEAVREAREPLLTAPAEPAMSGPPEAPPAEAPPAEAPPPDAPRPRRRRPTHRRLRRRRLRHPRTRRRPSRRRVG